MATPNTAPAPEAQAAPPPKPFWQSKVMIINAVAAALTALEASTGLLKPVLGDGGLYIALSVALPVINAALRTVTTRPIGKAESDALPAEGGQP